MRSNDNNSLASDRQYKSQLLSPSEYGQWDDRIERSERGTLFHQTHWLNSFDRCFVVIGCYKKTGELVGGLPLSFQRLGRLKIGRPPYLTPYSGPVAFSSQGRSHRALTLEKEVTSSLIKFATTFCDFIRIPLAPNHNDIQPFRQNGFKLDDIQYTYLVELDSMDNLWQGLNQDKRRKIKKGYREGLSNELSDDLDQFFPLWERSLIAHDKGLSAEMVKEVRGWYNSLRAGNRARLLLIRDNRGRIHAGSILTWDSGRAYYLLSGMDRDFASSNAMTLLVWECMRYCYEEIGVQEFDFDGSDVPTVERFFRGFGGRLTPRYTVSWCRSFVRPIRHIWKGLDSIKNKAKVKLPTTQIVQEEHA